jgi:hypothetical protein
MKCTPCPYHAVRVERLCGLSGGIIVRNRHATLRAPLGAALSLLLAVACSGGADKSHDSAAVADSAANATAAQTGAAPAGDEIDIEDVKLGRALNPDSTVTDATDDFKAGDTIYAVMETDANESGKQLTARWTMGDNDQVISEETRAVATGEKARTVFKGKEGGWAPGKYHLRLLYNGKESNSTDFDSLPL